MGMKSKPTDVPVQHCCFFFTLFISFLTQRTDFSYLNRCTVCTFRLFGNTCVAYVLYVSSLYALFIASLLVCIENETNAVLIIIRHSYNRIRIYRIFCTTIERSNEFQSHIRKWWSTHTSMLIYTIQREKIKIKKIYFWFCDDWHILYKFSVFEAIIFVNSINIPALTNNFEYKIHPNNTNSTQFH